MIARKTAQAKERQGDGDAGALGERLEVGRRVAGDDAAAGVDDRPLAPGGSSPALSPVRPDCRGEYGW